MHRRAFSILELSIVVAILAMLVAIALPQYANMTERSRFKSTHNTFTTFEKAILLYQADYGDLPNNYYHFEFPEPFANYIKREDWMHRPAIGQYWEWNNPRTAEYWNSIGCNIAIRDTARPYTLWISFDTAHDDGDLDTGHYRRMGDYLCHPIK
jgi:prepilin-type N-terminal cleavage/methylation domain-containing protein